ncbi:MAG: dTMP kinase [bacterium]
MPQAKKGTFIAFEGLDGSGESTQVALLAERLLKDGHKVLVTKEPTNNIIGGLIRGALTHEWKPTNRVIQLLYAADRGHHLQREILPALEKGFVVITDRYFWSTIAFGSLDMDPAWLEMLNEGYQLPDLAFYVNVSPKAAMGRMESSRFELELFEKEEKLSKISATYASLLKKYPVLTDVNGERDREVIHKEIYDACKNYFKK